jgi:hypothetical protein
MVAARRPPPRVFFCHKSLFAVKWLQERLRAYAFLKGLQVLNLRFVLLHVRFSFGCVLAKCTHTSLLLDRFVSRFFVDKFMISLCTVLASRVTRPGAHVSGANDANHPQHVWETNERTNQSKLLLVRWSHFGHYSAGGSVPFEGGGGGTVALAVSYDTLFVSIDRKGEERKKERERERDVCVYRRKCEKCIE